MFGYRRLAMWPEPSTVNLGKEPNDLAKYCEPP
jgi:hypothetical protein